MIIKSNVYVLSYKTPSVHHVAETIVGVRKAPPAAVNVQPSAGKSIQKRSCV